MHGMIFAKIVQVVPANNLVAEQATPIIPTSVMYSTMGWRHTIWWHSSLESMISYTKHMMALATQLISCWWVPMIQRPLEPSHCSKIPNVKAEACGLSISRLQMVIRRMTWKLWRQSEWPMIRSVLSWSQKATLLNYSWKTSVSTIWHQSWEAISMTKLRKWSASARLIKNKMTLWAV